MIKCDLQKVLHAQLMIYIFIFISLFTIENIISGNIKCDYCGAYIENGKYLQVGQKHYHPDHFRCNSCNQPIGKDRFVQSKGKQFHQQCYRNNILPQCAICSEPIENLYTELEGKQYHADCYSENLAPKCGICKQPLDGAFVTSDNKNYHRHCYESDVALTCSHCNKIIRGNYLVDYWGNHYHQSHEGKVPKCAFCGRFLSDRLAGGGFVFSDKYKVCARCEETSMSSPTLSRRLIKEVAGRLAQIGINVNPDNIPLQLVSEYNLAQLGSGERGDNFGLTKNSYETIAGKVVSQEFSIYILDELPRLHFISTAAHELMHVWLYLNAPRQTDKQLTEGSCNYASRLVLDQFRSKKAEYLIENIRQNQDHVYGSGFRRVEKLVRDYGIENWLNQLRQSADFPAGY